MTFKPLFKKARKNQYGSKKEKKRVKKRLEEETLLLLELKKPKKG